MCAVEEGFGTLCEKYWGGVAVREERRKDIGLDGIREGSQCR